MGSLRFTTRATPRATVMTMCSKYTMNIRTRKQYWAIASTTGKIWSVWFRGKDYTFRSGPLTHRTKKPKDRKLAPSSKANSKLQVFLWSGMGHSQRESPFLSLIGKIDEVLPSGGRDASAYQNASDAITA